MSTDPRDLNEIRDSKNYTLDAERALDLASTYRAKAIDDASGLDGIDALDLAALTTMSAFVLSNLATAAAVEHAGQKLVAALENLRTAIEAGR